MKTNQVRGLKFGVGYDAKVDQIIVKVSFEIIDPPTSHITELARLARTLGSLSLELTSDQFELSLEAR